MFSYYITMSGFMDTFFFISLGITFVLILLLVYHFKQRLSATEQKCDTMFEIINGMASEMTSIKGVLMSRPPINHNNGGIQMFRQPGENPGPINIQHGSNEMTADHIINSDDEVEEESESGTDSGDESDSDSDSDSDNEDSNPSQSLLIAKDGNKILVSDGEEETVLDIVSIPIVEEPVIENYSKMTLAQLKTIVMDKSLVENASKLKKSELIELLEAH